MRHNFIFIFIFAAIFLAGSVHAQTTGSSGVDPVQFVINPDVPGPNQLTTVEVQGVGTFLGDANITWQLNGKTVAAGVGVKKISFTTGDIGVTSRVHVTINSSIQGTIVRDFSFTPTRINLIWEADTSVPPMYLGKALYSAGSTVSVTAFPQVVVSGKTVSPNNLSFHWSLNDTPNMEQSGTGHNVFTFQGSQLNSSERVSVDVYFGSALVGQSSISIPAVDPQVLFYNKDPLRGVVYDQAFPSTISLAGQEITLQAVPYYFANESFASGATTYSWQLNGNDTSGPDSANGTLTLRQSGNGAGQASLSVQIQDANPTQFVQAAQAALTIIFGGQSSTNNSSTFGL